MHNSINSFLIRFLSSLPPSDILSAKEVKYLLEIFEKRYDTWPTIFCTQYKQTEWHLRLCGCVIADAIMDCIVLNSETINSGTTNMR
ncbi:MAG TPA: hypothetical protein DEO83_02380 [Lachnospiraceae bacterium]|nr:hypothetical protein [Lachnospiraceae bacterium]